MKTIRPFVWMLFSVLFLTGCAGNSGKDTSGSIQSTDAAIYIESAETMQTSAASVPTESVKPERLAGTGTAGPESVTDTEAVKPESRISEDEARQITLDHAGISTPEEVLFVKMELDREHGREVYEIEFYFDDREYDYELDAVTGTILSYDCEMESFGPGSGNNQQGPGVSSGTGNDQSMGGSTYISETEVKKLAFAHAEVTEEEVARLKVELDVDDGRAEYKVEFEVGRTEYEYEMDAVTGAIISFEKEYD